MKGLAIMGDHSAQRIYVIAKQKEGKMCYILSLSIIGLVFFGDIVSN